MRKINILYWVFTAPFAAFMFLGAIPNLMSAPDSTAIFDHLGYPAYLLPFLGVAKILGSLAIVVPGFPRLKEWAYAGLVFDLTGAMYSVISVGDPASSWIFFVLFYFFAAGSYMFYHRKRKGVSSGNAEFMGNSTVPSIGKTVN
ncbi:DoxX family protein [Paenibacillus allorhizosphaerae]|uniref:DoxX family protein n=1 Tax=Paenibacillus allorhizosphaerae TaxID=2849866 RepID=A0ABN7TM32_9BACL|nr:DoxX family protein [Paenibacillus allorhizosphaerae]CAG7646586.1 hypothetical protein PAECIP111802_03783 [Paenibacillus allorhizosphaerae]